MLNSTTCKTTYTIQDGVYSYPVGFEFIAPEHIAITIDGVSGILGVDYNVVGTSVVLEELNVGKRLVITRSTPFTQESDYQVGRINPEQIEKDFDATAMKMQELKRDYEGVADLIADAEQVSSEAKQLATAAKAESESAASIANIANSTAESAKSTAENAASDAAAATNTASSADMTATTAMEIAEEAATIAQGAEAAVANKQDKLVAGQGITIDGNTISATDGYSKTEIDNKISVIEVDIDANADAIQKTRADFIAADSELSQMINAHAAELTSVRSDLDDLGDQVSDIEAKIPGDTTTRNPLVTKSDLSTTEQMIRADVNSQDSMLQTQITAHASAIAGKQDKLSAGENITIVDNVISSTGGGGWNGIRWNKRLMVTMPTQEEYESEPSRYNNPYQSMFTTPALEDGDYYFYHMSLGLPGERGLGIDTATFEKKFIVNFTVKNGVYYKGSASRVDGFSFMGNSSGSLYSDEVTFGVWSHGNGRLTFGSQGWPAAYEGYQYIANLFEQTINVFSLTTIVNKQTDDEYVFESLSGQFGWGIYDEHVGQYESYSTLQTIGFMPQQDSSTIHLSTLGEGSQNCIAGYVYIFENGDMAQSGIDLFMRTSDDYHNWVDFHIDVRAKTFTRKIIGSGIEPFNSMNVGFDSANNKVCLFLPDESEFTLSQSIYVYNRFKESSTPTWLFSENFSESDFDALEQFTEIEESAGSGGGISKEEADATYLPISGGRITGELTFGTEEPFISPALFSNSAGTLKLFDRESKTVGLSFNIYGISCNIADRSALGDEVNPWGQVFTKKLNAGSGDLIVPTEGGTLARLEDLEGIGGTSLPDQTDNAGKFLMTDGADVSWGEALVNKSTASSAIAVGEGASATHFGLAIGNNTTVTRTGFTYGGVALGYGANTVTGSIMLNGSGNLVYNDTPGTFKVATNGAALTLIDTDGTIPADRHAALPAENGTYVLKLVIADGVPTLSWVQE